MKIQIWILKMNSILKALPRNKDYKTIHSIADTLAPAIRREFLLAMKVISDTVSLRVLTKAIETGGIDAIIGFIDKINVAPATYRKLTTTLRSIFEDSGIGSIKHLPKSIQAQISFDILNSRSVAFLRRYEFDLIQNISRNTREGVREILRIGFEEAQPPIRMAREIKEFIGLTPRQVKALNNHRAMLISEGRPPKQVVELTNRFKNRQLRFRANNIARTETIRAASEGQEELWNQAAEQGLIDPVTARKKWIVTPDDRLCPICRPIPGANKDGVPLNGAFKTSVGLRKSPPAHPQCRCSMSLVNEAI